MAIRALISVLEFLAVSDRASSAPSLDTRLESAILKMPIIAEERRAHKIILDIILVLIDFKKIFSFSDVVIKSHNILYNKIIYASI